MPTLGYLALVYDKAIKIAGKNNNSQRVNLFNNIEACNFTQCDFTVQLFPKDGMCKGIDLFIPARIVLFEVNPLIRLGRLTLNRNPTNFFAQPESISFAPAKRRIPRVVRP